jgi:hypothetical protein
VVILIGFAVREFSQDNFEEKEAERQYNQWLLDWLVGFRDARFGLAFDGSRIDLTPGCFGQTR